MNQEKGNWMPGGSDMEQRFAEYDEMKDKTGKYKRYSTFDELIDEVQNDT